MDDNVSEGPITKWIQQMIDLQQFSNENLYRFKTLTKREVEVLSLVARGLKNQAIADKLKVSKLTIQNHRSGIRQKLDIDNQVDYVKYALAYDLIEF
ncbi:MAG: helix-turn-helix transcriptional regulator [Balneolales bacterium]